MCADTPEYKDTLNLPKTDFPMRAGLPQREPEWLERWEQDGRLRPPAREDRPQPFHLHDGPPYANGHLHIGHALNKILKDMVVRSPADDGQMRAISRLGLPRSADRVEDRREIPREGQNKDDVPIRRIPSGMPRVCRGWVDIQREEFKRLGRAPATGPIRYLTMDFHAERVIAEEFQKFLMNGTLYQGSKPVMWSPVEQTALAEAEVEYHDKESFTIWVKFTVGNMRKA